MSLRGAGRRRASEASWTIADRVRTFAPCFSRRELPRCRRRGSSSAATPRNSASRLARTSGRRPSPSRRRRSGRRRAWRSASALQRAGVIAASRSARRRPASSVSNACHRSCSAPSASRLAVDSARGLALRLAQDVDDALVGGGERVGLGQRLERLHGGELRRARGRSALGPLREHRFDLVGRVALLAQVAAQPLVEEARERPRARGFAAGTPLNAWNAQADQRSAAAMAAASRSGCAGRRSPRAAGRTDPCRRSAPARCRTGPPALRACRRARRACATRPSRQRVAGEARPVVLRDRVGNLRAASPSCCA